ncbi:MsnO8 family LLM class oxidoreductase [Actinomadura oligospora]|uniref:MsnO8 family LLM class oxidoreductase n=1 Tax=Actinomadura oligospora TaxID=111804 RepID=UPI0004B7D630|nr:MsnO8 family LLM class oxidoreductase [Actinomadura oligospora]
MSDPLRSIRWSILDRSRTRDGEEPSQALRNTVAFAQQADELGFHRFWVAEHHSVPGVAGSAPTVLAAAVAAATSHVRVGTGGVMLPNHQPLIVAEQFGVLASLHPDRIDMGLGRSVGFTGGVRRALGHDREDAADFATQIHELLGYFSGEQDVHPGVHAWPAEGLRVPAFILATGQGADLAAQLGLPLVIAPARGEDAMVAAIERYREAFRPSAQEDEPYVIVSGTVAIADTTEEARRMLVPEAWAQCLLADAWRVPAAHPRVAHRGAHHDRPAAPHLRRLHARPCPRHRRAGRGRTEPSPHAHARRRVPRPHEHL